MDFVVLGPVQLLADDGTRIRLASDAQRRLLSLLVLRANTIVRSAWLEDALDLSAGALRTSVSRLRQTVGFEVLVTAAPGYELRTDRIDALEFERLIADTSGLADDRPAAARHLRTALGLWHGLPYEEFAHEPWAQAEAQRLVELRSGAVERLAELEVEAGDTSTAIARLRELINDQPFRDEPHRLLMLALARAGRRADALRAFQRYRRLLLDEVGTEPSAEIVELDREIAAAPCPGALDDLQADDAVEDDTATIGLPVPWSSYVGREADTAIVVDLIGSRRLVTLTGAGGCGKTRLALAAAHALVAQRQVAVWWADLVPATTPDGVTERILAAGGGTAVPGRDPVELLVRRLRSAGPSVLVIDNAEHVLDPVTRLTQRLLLSCPEVTVLVTSREPLGIVAEHIWRVPALSLPDAEAGGALGAALRSEAVRLLVERVTAARPGLELDDDAVPALVAICRGVDGLPLALELAAASVRTQPLDEVAAHLGRSLDLLASTASEVAHHRTMRASIAWSIETLDPMARRLLRRIAVCVLPFTAERAMAVGADEDLIHPPAAQLALASLVDKNLVHLDDATGRYRMLETTRQFCLERSDADDPSTSADIERARARLARNVADWCLAVGQATYGIDRAPFVAEMPQVAAASAWARDHDPACVTDICRGLASIRSVLGHASDLAATWEWLCSFDRDGPLVDGWAPASAALFTIASASDLDVADMATAIDERLHPDDESRRWLTRGLAMGPAYRGHLDATQQYARDITARRNDVEISVYVGFTAYMSAMCGQLGEADHWLDELHRMLLRQEEPFRVDTVGNGFAAAVLTDLGRGRLSRASMLARGPVPRDPSFSATAASAVAQLAVMTGSDEALEVATRWGRCDTIPFLHHLPTLTAFFRASFDQDLERAAVLALEYGDAASVVPVSRVHPQAFLNVALLETERVDAVRIATEDCARLVAEMAWAPSLEAVVDQSRAQLALATGDLEGATAAATDLLDRAVANDFAIAEVDAMELLGVTAHLAGSPERSHELLASAGEARARLGYRHVMVAPRHLHDRALAEVNPPTSSPSARLPSRTS